MSSAYWRDRSRGESIYNSRAIAQTAMLHEQLLRHVTAKQNTLTRENKLTLGKIAELFRNIRDIFDFRFIESPTG